MILVKGSIPKPRRVYMPGRAVYHLADEADKTLCGHEIKATVHAPAPGKLVRTCVTCARAQESWARIKRFVQ